jgi:drug/metabolite transporter (DMT)-like permease
VSRSQALTLLALVVAVGAISTSGPLIAYAAASGLAISFWRNAFSLVPVVPAAAVSRRAELREASRRTLLVCVAAGLALAVHFAAWVPSVKLTAVATATALTSTQPVWQGLIALGQGRRLPRLVWLGIVLAVGGAALASGFDLVAEPRAFAGDLLAVLGGIGAAVYTAFGERARVELSTTGYTAICYTVATVGLLAACLVAGVDLHGFAGTTWLAIAAMTLGPQLLGHSMFSYAMRHISATTVAVLILLEVPGAALISWLWLDQTPPARQWPGLAVLVAGVVVVVIGSRKLISPVGATPVEAAAS